MTRPRSIRWTVALSLALLAAPTLAEENRFDGPVSMAAGDYEPPRSRTLSELVSLALASGADTNLNPDLARDLGLRPDMRARVIRYSPRVTPDNLEHSFQVIYREGKAGALEPVSVLLGLTEISLRDAMKHIDRLSLLVSLEGELQRAAVEHGRYKQITHSSAAVAGVQDYFRRELRFYEKTSMALPLAE
jgi:hypothetical protein